MNGSATAPYAGRTARPAVVRPQPPALVPSTAGAVATTAIVLAVTGDLLLRESTDGLGFAIWVALVSACMVPLAWRAGRAIPRESSVWLVVAATFAAGVAWRDSDTLELFDGLTAFGALFMAAVSVNDSSAGLFARRMRDTAAALLATVRATATGVVPLAFRELVSQRNSGAAGTRIRHAGQVALIAGPLVLVFGSLLRGADPIFAAIFKIPHVDLDDLASHAVFAGVLACGFAGWARSALLPIREPAPGSRAFGLRFDMLEITTALGTLNVLFGAFVATQLGWFFGGENFLRERTGLTAAEYARHGFFQMVVIVVLVLPLLVATRALLRPGRDAARRHTAVGLPLVALLGAIILSAALRLRLYVHYYGLSTDRFYPLVFMGWLAVVLVWFAVTVLRGWGRPFVAGSVISGLAMLAALNVVSPDEIIARINVNRARTGVAYGYTDVDLAYLATLSGEATPIVTRAILAPSREQPGTPARVADDRQRCSAAQRMLSHWGPWSSGQIRSDASASWRSRNVGEQRGLRVVGANLVALLYVEHATCPATRAAEHRP